MKLIKTLLGSAILLGTLLNSQSLFAETQTANSESNSAVKTEMPIVVGEKLNINTATASEIQKALLGIGAKKAEAIVQYREKHGAFTAAEQLLEVQGIGKATLEKNRDRIVF
ncbi:helix-hairpin-helix domain-containing protein [Pasteurellaceae bacterium 22721_9_1]